MNPHPPELSTWQPPSGYRQSESTVDGITVWAPAPEADLTAAPKTYTCPNCGASTRYDIASGGVACEYCGYTAPVKEERLGRQAEKFEFTLETLNQVEQGWGVERKMLHCDNCGAEITLDPGTLSTSCPFCASNKVNLIAAAASQFRPRSLIPFSVQAQTAKAKAVEWMGKGWYHPVELRTNTLLDRLNGIYLPFWSFDADITGAWKAEVGHERQERYYDASSKDWKTRTVIDWRWEDGQIGLSIDGLLVNGTSHVSRILLERLKPYELNALAAYSPDFLAGWNAQAYDITLTQAWEEGKNIMREQTKKACYDDIHSSHVRNFSMSADFANEAWRYLLLPVYLTSYRFENKVFQVMVNGQTGKVVGQKPVTWWKVWLAIALMLLPGVALSLVGIILKPSGGSGMPFLVAGLILFVVAVILSIGLFRQALSSEAA